MGTFGGASKISQKRKDTPSAHVARIGWILVTLLCERVVDYGTCIDRFGISRREFQRDLLKIREMGKERGFSVSRIMGGRVFLHAPEGFVGRLSVKNDDALDTLSRIAAALGGPIERELRKAIGERSVDQRHGFLHVRDVLPNDSEHVGGVFAFLKEAADGPARVEFSYKPARGARAVRRVEPYHVVARSGRYYLVGYDLRRRDWRYFALDAISGPMSKDGTFQRQTVPERFLVERAVGWIHGSAPIEMTVRVTSVVAASIAARTWQHDQRVVSLDDGGAEITLGFDDVGEGVRFALGFGAEALVVAPPEAVAAARQIADSIAARYAEAAGTGLRELAG